MPPQPSPQLWRGRNGATRAALILGLIVGIPVAFALGLLLLVVGLAAAVVALLVWLIGLVVAWVWFAIQSRKRIPYPFETPPPSTRRGRRIALSGLYLSLVPRTVGAVARGAALLFAPLALLVSLIGVFLPRWRARPFVAVFTLPAILRKVVRLGRRRGLLRDGHDALLLEYDDFLARAFPQIRDVLDWWNDPRGGDDYVPTPGLADVPGGLLGLPLGPSPDPLGQPGIAAGAMRRRSIRSLRELLLSQREIDDLCDPDLDDRADVGLVRVVEMDAPGGRCWMVQFASTKSWHPRAGAAPNDITADLLIGAGAEPTVTRAALETMLAARIAPGEPVLLAGFSLGGMVAAQVATAAVGAGLTVTHLVVAGSPLGRITVPDAVTVLALEHVLDPVPRIEGRENPVRLESGTPFLTVKARPPLSHGFRIGSLHQSTAYADTAGAVEADPPDPRVAAVLAELGVFFEAPQRINDHATVRAGGLPPRPSVPLYLHSTVEEGITRGTLRQTVRRLAGVIAVDVYQSRSGFATTIVWNADMLVRELDPWLIDAGRTAVYRGLLSLLARRRAVGIHLRLQARATPGITWESTVQRLSDGRWRETIDVTVDDRADPADVARLFPAGTAPVVIVHAPDAFDPVLDVARQR
ncbi:thioesterase domain-containing protein [Leifsonia sp. RAF41]|uniref:thioesterase domain-containing protein n=1 Tax=Leifsonia sp. RAF41 TaxID=3233056 RepID=UPI003F99646E